MWINRDATEVPGAAVDARIGSDAHPVHSGVVGTVQAAFLGVDDRVHAAPSGPPRHVDTNAAPVAAWQAVATKLGPVVAAVGGLVQTTAGTANRGVLTPRSPARIPHRGVDHLRVFRFERKIDRADLRTFIEHLLPVPAAVHGAIDSTLRVRSVRVPKRSNVDDVRIARMDQHAADLPGISKADILPRVASVGRLVHAVAEGDRGSHVRLARADVDHLGIGGRHRDPADGGDMLAVENRRPGDACVRGLPHASSHRPEVKRVGIARNAGDRKNAASTEGPDHAPFKSGVKVVRERLR